MEDKSVKFEFVGTNLEITVDPNKDGEAVLFLKLDLKEIPDEVLSAIKSKKEQA